MKMEFVRGLKLTLAALTILTAFAGQAQEPDRKIISRVAPKYPQEFRERGIGGRVRVEVVVSPGGKVEKTTVVGGNPALAAAAETAIQQWKFAAGPAQTKHVLTLNFIPRADQQ